MALSQRKSGASFFSRENGYIWPNWDDSWGKAPIIHAHIERPSSRPNDDVHFREELRNIANVAKQERALTLRAQLQYWAGKDIFFSLGEGNKAIRLFENSSALSEHSIRPPLMRHNPSAWYRYPTRNASSVDSELSVSVSNPVTEDFDPSFVKHTYAPSAFASPEQNLLLVLAAGKEFDQFYTLRVKVTEKHNLLSPEQKQTLIKQSAEHAESAKDNVENINQVNASMQSAITGFSPMDTDYFETASRLKFMHNGLPVLDSRSEIDFNFERREFGIASQMHPQITNNPALQKILESSGINLAKQFINAPLIDLRIGIVEEDSLRQQTKSPEIPQHTIKQFYAKDGMLDRLEISSINPNQKTLRVDLSAYSPPELSAPEINASRKALFDMYQSAIYHHDILAGNVFSGIAKDFPNGVIWYPSGKSQNLADCHHQGQLTMVGSMPKSAILGEISPELAHHLILLHEQRWNTQKSQHPTIRDNQSHLTPHEKMGLVKGGIDWDSYSEATKTTLKKVTASAFSTAGISIVEPPEIGIFQLG